MKRLNLAMNLFLFAAGLLATGTAVLLEWRLPRGWPASAMGFLGWGRHEWAEIHWWIGVLLIAGVTLHLALHWRWIWKIALRQRPVLALCGLGAVFLVVGFFAFAPLRPLEGRPGGGEGGANRWSEASAEAGTSEATGPVRRSRGSGTDGSFTEKR